MRILQRSAFALLLIVVTAGLFAAPVWAADWQHASDSLKTGSDDSRYADKSDDDGSRSGISEDSSKTGSRDSNYADKSDDDEHRKSGTWELELDGALEKTLKKADFENSVSFGYRASWTDAKGNVFEGMPLWRLVALVDDKNPTGSDSFNNSLAIKGYQIIVSPDDGKSVTLDQIKTSLRMLSGDSLLWLMTRTPQARTHSITVLRSRDTRSLSHRMRVNPLPSIVFQSPAAPGILSPVR